MIKYHETIQHWYNGGSPLSHDVANAIDVGHGTPIVVLAKRKLAALLLFGTDKEKLAFGNELGKDFVSLISRADVT